jgi:hypothetical protein
MDETDDRSHRSVFSKQRFPWLAILVAAAISIFIWFCGHEWGVANDCGAVGIQHDGQCGLASAMGDLFGLAGGAAFFLVGSVVVFVRWNRRTDRVSNAGDK